MADPQISEVSISLLFIHHEHQLIKNIEQHITQYKHSALKNFLQDKIEEIRKLMDGSNQETVARIVDKLSVLEKAVVNNWKKQYKWVDLNYYEQLCRETDEKNLIKQFETLLQLLQKLSLFKSQFKAAYTRLWQNAEKIKSDVTRSIQTNLDSYQEDYVKFKEKISEAQSNSKKRLYHVMQCIIQEKMSAYSTQAIFSDKLKQLEELSDDFRLQIEKKDEIEEIAQQYKAQLATISSEFIDLTDDEKRRVLRSIQNDPSIKSIFCVFQSECDIHADGMSMIQRETTDSIAKSLEVMQIYKKDVDDVFWKMKNFREEIDYAFVLLLSGRDQLLQANFFAQLFKIKDELLQEWDREVRAVKVWVKPVLLKLDQDQLDIKQLTLSSQALRDYFLKWAREALADFIKQMALQYKKEKCHSQLEKKKQEVHQLIDNAIKKKSEKPSHLTEQTSSKTSHTKQAASKETIQSSSKKIQPEGFFKRLFMEHWKAMLFAGLIGAIIVGSILTGGILAGVIGMMTGASLLATLIAKVLGVAIMMGGCFTTSTSLATMIGVSIMSMMTGIIVGIKTGLTITAFEGKVGQSKPEGFNNAVEMENGAGLTHLEAGSYNQIRQRLSSSKNVPEVATVEKANKNSSQLSYAGVNHSRNFSRKFLNLFCCGYGDDKHITSEKEILCPSINKK